MALGALFLLEVIILFSFIVSSVFMFLPKKNDSVHKIFFVLSVMLGVFVTIIDATSLPSNFTAQIVIAWMGLIPAALAVIICVSNGRPNAVSKILVMLTSVLGALGYFFLV